MLSYSVNTTFREEEYFNYEEYGDNSFDWNRNSDYQNDAPLPQDHFSVKHKGPIHKNIVYNPADPFFYNCDERIPTSLAPLGTIHILRKHLWGGEGCKKMPI